MSLRRYTHLLRAAMVWIVVLSLAVDTASACWWLKCRRSHRSCQPVCSVGASAAGYGDTASDTPTESTRPSDDDGWRPPAEGETAGYDEEGDEPGDSTVPAELLVPSDPAPGQVPEGDPLDELFTDDAEPAGPADDEDLLGSDDEELFPGDEDMEEELLEEDLEEGIADEGDTTDDEDLFGEEETTDPLEDEGLFDSDDDLEEPADDGDLFGSDDDLEDPADDGDLFGSDDDLEEPADDGDLFGTEVDDPAAEPGTEEDEDLFGPSEEDEDLFGPAEEDEDLFGTEEEEAEDLFGPAEEEEDLFGPAEEDEDLFGPSDDAAEEAEDLFGPAEDDLMEEETDDLFGSAEEEEDLFGPSDDAVEEAVDDEADDLFGPLDEEPVEEEDDEFLDPFGSTTVPAEALGMRTWVDNTGLYETNGRLLTIGEDSVQLLKDNGNTTTVPLRRLSDADRVLVEQVIAAIGLGEIDLVASR